MEIANPWHALDLDLGLMAMCSAEESKRLEKETKRLESEGGKDFPGGLGSRRDRASSFGAREGRQMNMTQFKQGMGYFRNMKLTGEV